MKSDLMEKYSSAVTLSDMEVFVFPELMYSLVLANIMSPVIWRWRDEDSFKKLDGKSPYKKLTRLKQFIMDEYEFNLDLNTWGLTRQEEELKRFEKFISPDDVARSNALFGYTGDKYYFDVDIRRHFGLDKYDGNVIPYWKTETVEAMDAFKLKEGYRKGAGECVSLSTLYAAAAYVVCGIPLEDIFLVLTPLHSQNFIDIQDGVLTNNRRIVTKPMWFNGTAISSKAQRAMRNEQVTIVANSTGYTHCFYDEATIDKDSYVRFKERMGSYLTADLSSLNFANFLRAHPKYQKYFQFCCQRRGEKMFVKSEVMFHYEHDSHFRIFDNTFDKLLGEISDEDFLRYKTVERLCCEQLMNFISYEKIDLQKQDRRDRLGGYLRAFVPEHKEFMEGLCDFLHVEARLPKDDKEYVASDAICLPVGLDRQEVIDYLSSIRESNITADLSFYAYRDMESCRWEPFVVAAMGRCPVSIEAAGGKSVDQVYDWLIQMGAESIYEGKRFAQPDEVVNFSTGDGIEKAFALANVIRSRDSGLDIEIDINGADVLVRAGKEYRFRSSKEIVKTVTV